MNRKERRRAVRDVRQFSKAYAHFEKANNVLGYDFPQIVEYMKWKNVWKEKFRRDFYDLYNGAGQEEELQSE